MKKAFGPKRSKGFRDKYLAPIMIVTALLISFIASAQVDTTKPLQKINAIGYLYNNIGIEGSLVIPNDTPKLRVADSGAISYVNNSIWGWNGYNWLLNSGGGFSDTSSLSGRIDTKLDTLQKVGTVFNSVFNLSFDTTNKYYIERSGSVITLTSAGFSISGGSNNYNSYIRNNRVTSSQNFTTSTSVIVNSVDGSTDYGIAIGYKSFMAIGRNLYLHLDLRYRTLKLYKSESNALLDSSRAQLTINIGDTIDISLTRANNMVSGYAYNRRTKEKIQTGHILTVLTGAEENYNNGGYPVIVHKGGTMTVLNFREDLNSIKNPDFLLIGDSNSEFIYDEDAGFVWFNQFAANNNLKWVNFANGGNSSLAYTVTYLQDITAHNPRHIGIMLGTNDAILGYAVTDYMSRLRASIDGLFTNNSRLERIYLSTLPPLTGTSVVPFNDSLKAQYTNDPRIVLIDIFPQLKATASNDLDARYDKGDGIHLSKEGHAAVAGIWNSIYGGFKVDLAKAFRTPKADFLGLNLGRNSTITQNGKTLAFSGGPISVSGNFSLTTGVTSLVHNSNATNKIGLTNYSLQTISSSGEYIGSDNTALILNSSNTGASVIASSNTVDYLPSGNLNQAFAVRSQLYNKNGSTWQNAFGFNSNASLTNNSTINYLYHFRANNANKLSGSILVNQYGFYASSLDSAIYNWAFYADGATKSYFGGGLLIDTLHQIEWGQPGETPHIKIIRSSIGELSIVNSALAYKDLKLNRLTAYSQSGYNEDYILDNLGDKDFIPKKIFLDSITALRGDIGFEGGDGTNIYNSNGTISGDRQINGNNKSLEFGYSGNNFRRVRVVGDSVEIAAQDRLLLSGPLVYGSAYGSGEGDVAVPNTNIITLAPLSANRTLYLDYAQALENGRIVKIANRNTSGTYHWAFAETVTDLAGNVIPLVPNACLTEVMYRDGQWWLHNSDTTGMSIGTPVTVENSLSSGSTINPPSVAAVVAGFESVVVASGNVLSKWVNGNALGIIADATGPTSGTNNSARFQAIYDSLPNGSTIYITGNIRTVKPIVWSNSSKIIDLVHEGGVIYSGDSTFLIVDSKYNHITTKGTISGRNISTRSNLTGLTNAAIYVRDGTNNIIDVNWVSGYQDMFRVGGNASGSAAAKGAQYNEFHFKRAYRNYRAIHITTTGSTTNGIKPWSNSNYYYGGEINCIEGVRFTQGPDQTDRFNQNVFNHLGFENDGFYPGVMDFAITGAFCYQNTFNYCRLEGNTIDVPVSLTNASSFFFNDMVFYDDELTGMGDNVTINGSIYSRAETRIIGTRAEGYTPITGSAQNGRIRIYGNRRIDGMAASVPTNVDIVWEKDTWKFATAGSYAVPYGIETVICNNAGSNTVTTAAVLLDEEVVITNIHATGSVTCNGITITGPNTGMRFKNLAGTMRLVGKW